jgi:radical SAM protein (TIGR01212 family)
MKTWDDKPYYSLSSYYKNLFGEKVYKISLNAGLTCPNRDGTLSTNGCIFCSEGGSGDFTFSPNLSINEQIEKGKLLLSKKHKGNKYIAYFQAFTNTYGDLNYLEKIYYEAANHPEIVGISIATRPDCLDQNILTLLEKLSSITKVWVELGLQTINGNTARFIRRGYDIDVFDTAVCNLNKIGVEIIVHLIIGLPNETREDIYKSVKYVCNKKISGIKLQLLHVLKHTDLEHYYSLNNFSTLSLDEYVDILINCIELIPENIVIHRITGDAPKKILVAPLWSSNKKHVLNTIHKELKRRNTFQGCKYI